MFTPMSSSRKAIHLPHYEDVYGERNADEQFDRYAESCEDETSSDEDKQPRSGNAATRGFFKKFSGQTRKKPSPETQGAARNSNYSGNSGSPTNNHSGGYQIQPSINRRQSIRAPASKKLTPKKGGMFSSFPTMEDSNTKTNDMADFVTPTKNGTSDTYPTPNSTMRQRNDMMADAFMTGGLGDLTDSFGTLEHGDSGAGDPFMNGTFSEYGAGDPFGSSAQGLTDPRLSQSQGVIPSIEEQVENFEIQGKETQNHAESIDGDAFIHDATPDKQHKHAAADEDESPHDSKAPSATDDDDGYHADEDELHQEIVSLQPKRHSGHKKVATTAKEVQIKQEQSQGKHVTRGQQQREMERRDAERLANRPRTRSIATGHASSRSRDTARTATLHRMAKKKVVTKTAVSEQKTVVKKEKVPKELVRPSGLRVSKRLLVRGTRAGYAEKAGLNWKGEQMNLKRKQVVVTISRDEVEDLGQYEKYF
ncbi:hypothetical protein LTR85_006157 [Meristemomyces frigidus]|nr:hypothetical protein LTR85_006157 [Meristemomyces frigidus]